MEPLTHEPGSDDTNWNESYYFVFYDKVSKIGGMSRVGFKPNKPEGMTFLFLFMPDGSIAAYHATDKCGFYPDRLKVEGMTHDCVKDGEWIYHFEGLLVVVKDSENLPKVREDPELISDLLDAELDLRFTAINDTYEYSKHMTPESLAMGKKSGDKHWEQIAKINGTVRLGDRVIKVKDVMGQRDHTHGIRDWTGIGNWFYFVIWFNETLAVNPAAIVGKDNMLGSGGFLFKNGENIPIMEIRLLSHEFREDGLFPVSTEMELLDANGEKHILKAKPGQIIPVPFTDAEGNHSVLVQSFGSFELDGRAGGYGTYETLRKGHK